MTSRDDKPSNETPAASRFAVIVRKSGRADRVAQILAKPSALVAAFASLEGASSEAERKALGELEQDLGGAFLMSPESVALDSMSSFEQLFELARMTFGRTVFSLEPQQLEALVFEVFPRKVMLEVDDASPLLEDLRLFYAFLDRVFPLAHAAACLTVIGAGAVERLAAAIASDTNTSPERAILVEGTKAGFDMYTPEGIRAFVEHKRAEAKLN